MREESRVPPGVLPTQEQGYWEATTPAAERVVQIWGTIFEKTTDVGILLMCIDITKRLLQAVLLVLLGDEHAEAQLCLLLLITLGQLGFVVKSQAYNERQRNWTGAGRAHMSSLDSHKPVYSKC